MFVKSVLLRTDHARTDQDQAKTRPLICVAGFIHDVSDFLDEHPGGPHLLTKNIGRDATTAFFGGVYDHSNAAHNVCSSSLCVSRICTDGFVYSASCHEAGRCLAWWCSSRSRGERHSTQPTSAHRSLQRGSIGMNYILLVLHLLGVSVI
jgi:hypothetical protein